jgi:hypothetical protein
LLNEMPESPKNCYLVGMDARKYVFLNWILPNWLFERII